MYRLNKENEITNMQRKDQKYETENKRLRAELVVLQRTCNTMRQERDAAFEEKQQALARAAAFEQDRDKVQRVFKVISLNIHLLYPCSAELDCTLPCKQCRYRSVGF